MYITPDKFDVGWYARIPAQKRKKGNQSTKQKYYYKDIITAFDIETTYIKEIDQSVMYIWQWQFGPDVSVVGRTWWELRRFIRALKEQMEDDERLVCFVHNLSFEFQFLSGIFEFTPESVFAIDHRKVLKATYDNWLEFRCSYLQTNMGLRSFCEKMGVKNYKLKMDYKKRRYWYTELTPKEMAYCLNDVRGLVEAIQKEMDRDGDNLYTIPLTSTGYARRDAKKAMRKVGRNYIQNQVPSYRLYLLLHEAFRGGNTHASRYYANQILKDVEGADKSSSYPDQICNKRYPTSKFIFKEGADQDYIEELIYKKDKAVLIRCTLVDVSLKDDLIPVPYIPISKCKGILHGVYDNGRVLEAKVLYNIALTDLDYRIIKDQYNFTLIPIEVAYARYGKLPQAYVDTVIEYYQNKTDLKNKPGDDEHDEDFYELLYNKYKNLLNSLFGLMAQNPVKVDIKYVDELELFEDDPEADPEEILQKHNKKAFLLYQWGVWVCAWGRYELQRGIDHILYSGTADFVYCDTDSCKYIGEIDWEDLNKDIRKTSEKNNTFATDPLGEKHYMGLWEKDSYYKNFLTMGAKKYAYVTLEENKETGELEEKLHITIAGVNKKIGAIELQRAGGISAMKEGFTFRYAGGLEARYSDHPDIGEWINEDGLPIPITRNVSLVENTKTLGLTAEYRELLNTIRRLRIEP